MLGMRKPMEYDVNLGLGEKYGGLSYEKNWEADKIERR
jgi:hypothetical protein